MVLIMLTLSKMILKGNKKIFIVIFSHLVICGVQIARLHNEKPKKAKQKMIVI